MTYAQLITYQKMGLICPKSEMESLQSSVAKLEISLQIDFLVWKFHTGGKIPPPPPARKCRWYGIQHWVPGAACYLSQDATALWVLAVWGTVRDAGLIIPLPELG